MSRFENKQWVVTKVKTGYGADGYTVENQGVSIDISGWDTEGRNGMLSVGDKVIVVELALLRELSTNSFDQIRKTDEIPVAAV